MTGARKFYESLRAATLTLCCCTGCAVEVESPTDPIPTDEAWDEMTPDERVESLVGEVRRRLEALESAGVEDVDAEASFLAGLISSLRAELWTTDAGRKTYRELVGRLEKVAP